MGIKELNNKRKELKAQQKVGKAMVEHILKDNPDIDIEAFSNEVLEEMQKGHGVRHVCEKYGVKSTILQNKKSRKMQQLINKAMKGGVQ